MIFLHFAGRKILDESIKSWICTLIDGGGSPQEVYRLPQERLFNTYQPQECLPLFAERGTPRPQLWVKRRLPRLGERMHAPSFGSSYLLTTVAFPFSMPGQVQMAGKAGRCHFTWDLRYESATSLLQQESAVRGHYPRVFRLKIIVIWF